MKYVLKTTHSTLPISEDEVVKCIKAMDTKGIVVLKSGVVNGAFIASIEKDLHAERGYNYGYTFRGEDGITRKDYITNISDKIEDYKKELGNTKLLNS